LSTSSSQSPFSLSLPPSALSPSTPLIFRHRHPHLFPTRPLTPIVCSFPVCKGMHKRPTAVQERCPWCPPPTLFFLPFPSRP
jgi:hypothetical protein